MKKLKQKLGQIGIDGVILILLSIIGIFLSVYDFLGGGQISPSLLVGVLSLLVLEIILQRLRFDDVKEEIIKSLNGVQTTAFSNDDDFQKAKHKLMLSADRFVYDTELCPPPRSSSISRRSLSDFRKVLNEQIRKGSIVYKYIRVISDRDGFEMILRSLFEFYNYKYYIGYFIGPPETIPVLNVMIFDDKYFVLGGYYGPSARGEDRNLYLQSEIIGFTIRHYFDYLWSKARLLTPLKKGIKSHKKRGIIA
ncbi:MAG TPA: hypothetical protein PKH77_24115, partial [Anaerolineae bacterium]|nr:hypothetical protein [Anaerolineae bacterium]